MPQDKRRRQTENSRRGNYRPIDPRGSVQRKKQEQSKGLRRKLLIAFLSVTLVFLVVAGIFVGTVYAKINNMTLTPEELQALLVGEDYQIVDETDNPEDLAGLEEEAPENLGSGLQVPDVTEDDVINILLFGVDARDYSDYFKSRTDSIILMTLDRKNNTIKLTSFMRDILLDYGDKGKNRINTWFLLGGGPEGAMDLIEQYFGVKVDHYAITNMKSMVNIIDTFDGVDVDVESGWMSDINQIIGDMSNIYKTNKLKSPGMQHLNGLQAVAFARIREHSGGDFMRTSRQRIVISELKAKASKMTLPQALSIMNTCSEYIRTDMTAAEMEDYLKIFYDMRDAEMEQLRIPSDGNYKMVKYNKMSVINVDFKQASAELQQFVYGVTGQAK